MLAPTLTSRLPAAYVVGHTGALALHTWVWIDDSAVCVPYVCNWSMKIMHACHSGTRHACFKLIDDND